MNNNNDDVEEYLLFTYNQIYDGIIDNKDAILIGYHVDENNAIYDYYLKRSEWYNFMEILLDYAISYEKYEYCEKIKELRCKL